MKTRVHRPIGRNPKPSNLKLLTGGKVTNLHEPKPEPFIPDPPPILDEEGVAEWKRKAPGLHALGLISLIDSGAFAIYCDAWSRWVKARKTLAMMEAQDPNSGGLIMRTKSGNHIQNPIVGIVRSAAADVVNISVQFGMTPGSRSRIDAEAAGRAQVHDDPADEYFA